MATYRITGSLKEVVQNPIYTFIQGMGYLHLTFGITAITYILNLFWDVSWFRDDQLLVESIVGQAIVIVLATLGAHALGRFIEWLQLKLFKQSVVDMNDVWWTTFGGPIASVIFLIWGADANDSSTLWITGVGSIVLVVVWLIKKYVKR